MPRSDTPRAKFGLILSGHYVREAEYQVVRELGSDDWLVIHSLKGRGQLGVTTGTPLVIEPGCSVLYRPHTLHDYRCDPVANRWEFIWAHFHPPPAWEMDLLSWPQVNGGPFILSRPAPTILRRVVRALRGMLVLEHGPWPQAHQLAMNALEQALLWLSSSHDPTHGKTIDPLVLAAQEYVCRNLADDITLQTLAQATAQSVSRLSHSFKSQTGLTPREFLEQRRLARAAQLLTTTSMAINQIATEVGFASPFYFSLRFKKYMGVGPRGWRNQQVAPWK